MVKPITPREVVSMKQGILPDEVLEAFNELIAKHWNGRSSTFTQDAAARMVLKKLRESGKDFKASDLYDNHWLDVEDIYRKAGWGVDFDKPGYNETYDATFCFKKKRHVRPSEE